MTHVEIGTRALTRGWLHFDTYMLALSRLESGFETVEEVWIASGFLSREHVDLLCDEIPWSQEEEAEQDSTETLVYRNDTLVHQRKPPQSSSDPWNRSSSSSDIVDPATSSIAETMFPPAHNDLGAKISSDEWRTFEASDELAAIVSGQVSERYVIEEEIGRGGGGHVYRAFDRALGRVVAMKLLRQGSGDNEQARKERFISEARATGRLEHPNIIPIHDVGLLPDGSAYYTMSLLTRSSLRHVLRHLGAQDEHMRKEYPLSRLLHIFLEVCQAVAYAHAQGMVHRDLKPDNIMLGEYGEVLVTDWGLARLMAEPAEVMEADGGAPATLGTPAYMPPEQALGRLDLVDELSDVYALGAILYEVLTLCPPYEGASAIDVLEQVASGNLISPSKRAMGRHIPKDLEDICLRAMSTERERRTVTPIELHDEVLGYVEGLRSREAKRKVFLGRTASREYFRTIDDIEEHSNTVRSLREEIPPHAEVAVKAPLWAAEDHLKRDLTRQAQSYSDAVRAFTQALAYDPNLEKAKRGLADLYWSRFQTAEKRKEIIDQIHYTALIRQMDREKHYVDLLEGNGSLVLNSDPPGAPVTLLTYKESQRVLRASKSSTIGATPVRLERLEMGSYLALVELPGYLPAHYPIWVGRCKHVRATVKLLKEKALPDAFKYIPGGPFLAGGDPDALNSDRERTLDVPPFAIATDHVTFAEYLEFLDAVQTRSPNEALKRAPQTRDGDGPLAVLENGRWQPKPILIEGEARRRYPLGAGHELQLPIMCIDVEDALAYVAWRSHRDGLAYRLPTAIEREKAARGVDGRVFPWGDHFDATFCKMRLSRPEMPQPEPVGVFPTDLSVYGVRDLAGGVQDWCRDDEWSREFAANPTVSVPDAPLGELPPESCRVGGGAWNLFEDSCRAASRVRVLSIGRSVGVGMRLALDVND